MESKANQENEKDTELAYNLELSDDEQKHLLYLERKVERAFYEAGKALTEIRDRQLYRHDYQTFEEYVKTRFCMKQSRSYQLMDAAKVVDNLLPKVPQIVEVSDESLKKVPQIVEVLPTNEAQCRPLTFLEPAQQVEAWTQAVDLAGGKVPPARIVKDVVQQIRERTKVENPWRVGEVATIIVKENPDLRGKGGCWAIVTEVHDFSCTVRLWDGDYQVKPENLKDLSYSNEQQEAMKKLADRLSNISLDDVEKPTQDFLKGLGKLARPWLTELEESLLSVLEKTQDN